MQRALLVVALSALLCGSAASGHASITAGALTVKSTLDGKTVLPHRIHWLALTTLPGAQVSKVEFLIDGKVKWIEHKAPYTYGDDGGYLVTSWLTGGLHVFTVRVSALDGATGTDTVRARVVPPPPVPQALAGKWKRDVAPSNGPAGVYTLDFNSKWVQSRNPGKYTLGPGANQSDKTGRGWIFDTDWTYGPTRFHVQGWVAFRVFVAGPYGLEEGGGWCDNGGPGADYTWSVAADTLTLKPVGGRDACPYRNAVWPGTWTRVH